MGLLSTVAIIAVVVIVIIGAVLVMTYKTANTKLTVQQAEGLVVNDIKAQNPTANVSQIGAATNSSLAPNSWVITLSVVYNGTRPCPTVQIEQFDYPATGLQSTTSTTYSYYSQNGCTVPSSQNQNQQYNITLPDKSSIAIATSYASGNNSIGAYVDKFGYANTFVTARFQGGTNSGAFGNETNVWLVRYKATNANYSLIAVLDQSGVITQTFNNTG